MEDEEITSEVEAEMIEHFPSFIAGAATVFIIVVLMGVASCISTQGKVDLIPFPEKGELCVIEWVDTEPGVGTTSMEEVITECYLDPQVIKESTDE